MAWDTTSVFFWSDKFQQNAVPEINKWLTLNVFQTNLRLFSGLLCLLWKTSNNTPMSASQYYCFKTKPLAGEKLSTAFAFTRAILLVLSPASGQNLASVFCFFTAQIKANRWMYHQHGTKNRIQRTATMEDAKRVWASCLLLEFCPSPCSYVSKVGGVGVGGEKQTDVWKWNIPQWLGAETPQLNQWNSGWHLPFSTVCCPQT